MPLGRRQVLQQRAQLRGQRGRCHRLGQNPQSRAFLGFLIGYRLPKLAEERIPRRDLAIMSDRLRAIRIV
jgi:hypothetical protein